MPSEYVTAEDQRGAAARFKQREDQAKRLGNHLWIAVISYYVPEEKIERLFKGDHSFMAADMAVPPGIGCFVCEEEYSPHIALRRCKGEPKK